MRREPVASLQRGNILGVSRQPQFIFVVRAPEPGRSEVDAVQLNSGHIIQTGSDQQPFRVAGMDGELSRLAASE